MSGHPKLEFYYFQSCPFCQLVMRVIDQHKIVVEPKDIMESPEYRDFLVQDTGRATVPCLYIDGKPMHESMDIIKWLEENLSKLETA